ncbi:hypothetical protein [Nocardia sp. NPDC047038]|uniref:hypothetical protein n=1 Tax=Nocardia sp. NPDC047038 TaxID=3154338 RepID=UPI0033C1EED1
MLNRPLVARELDDETEAAGRHHSAGVRRRVSRFLRGGRLDEATLYPTVEQVTGRPPRTVEQVTGRPPRTFEQWSTAHPEAFAPHRAASGDPGA